MTTTQTATETAIPLFCGPMTDMNRDQTCARVGRIYSLRSWQADIDREVARLSRLRGRNVEWRQRNLAKWIEDAQGRQDRVVAQILAELPECTHAVEDRREIAAIEDALPPCTC